MRAWVGGWVGGCVSVSTCTLIPIQVVGGAGVGATGGVDGGVGVLHYLSLHFLIPYFTSHTNARTRPDGQVAFA